MFLMQNGKSVSALLLVVFVASGSVFGQRLDVTFDRLPISEQRAAAPIYCVMQDSKGYMWLGSMDGLHKYNGYDVKTYTQNPADSTALQDDWVLSLHEDDDGFIWIGTNNGGLHRFNRKTGKFKNFPVDDFLTGGGQLALEGPIPFSLHIGASITTIFEDERENLWLGTWGGAILRFSREKQVYQNLVDKPPVFSHPITTIFPDSSGGVWVGTFGSGLYHYKNFHENAFQKPENHFQTKTAQRNSLPENRITSIIEPKTGTLLVGTFGGGISVIDAEKETFTNYDHLGSGQSKLSSSNVVKVYQDRFGEIWIGCYDGGLNRALPEEPNRGEKYDLQSLRFTSYKHEPADQYSLSNSDVIALAEDRGGVLWVGTHRGGLNKFSRLKARFAHFTHESFNPNSLNDKIVYSFAEDQNGALWIGAYHGGLNKYDRKTQRFTHYRHDPQDPNSLSDNHIRALHFDDEGILWIGTRNGGLNRFDPRTETFKNYRRERDNPRSLLNDQIIPICEDRDGELWIGIFGGGVSRFNKRTETFQNFTADTTRKNGLSGNRIYSILEDHQGAIWFGSFGSGLTKLDKTTGRFTQFVHDGTNSASLGSNRILAMYEDKKQRLWIGTFGAGLCRLESEANGGEFVSFTKNDGLPSNAILGVLEDDHGNLWLSTSNGVACFDPETKTSKNYDVYDGLQGNQFNGGAFYQSSSGEMFFGGPNGFNAFYPDEIRKNDYVPPVVFTEFKKFNQAQDGEFSEIELSYKENFFSVEFAALDYANPETNQYKYKLEDFHDDWIDAEGLRTASFTNLDPGTWRLKVMGANSDGAWNPEPAILTITITPPFWMTYWFYALIVFGALVAVLALHTWRLRYKINHTLELEKVRATENEKVRQQAAEDFHDEFGHQLTHISLYAEIAKRKLNGCAPEMAPQMDKISDTAKRLSLGIRDFIWSLDPVQNTLFDTAVFIKDFGDNYFSKSGINFWSPEIPGRAKSMKLPMNWRRHISLIFKEGMSNILKHSNGADATFEVKMFDDGFQIRLTDNGRGFEQNGADSGYGLASMTRRADKLGVKLKVQSAKDRGTTIEVRCSHVKQRL